MKFILTKELGRLVSWLRILGFDTIYFKQDNSAALMIEALRDNRIIVTRNRHLPVSRGVRIVLIRAEKIKEQIAEALKELGIQLGSCKMFSRCIICNKGLVDIDRDNAKGRVPEYVFDSHEKFIGCPECGRIYWQGTHWGNITKTLEEITGS